ncbi:ABC transporter ATP-binding protein [Brevundimonas sp.]|jgi:iron complex transport system ATP-binding protein|uniref:ABC transporter ATP-binding protein n=1 Tax=Brevundimonas sp. TaxID=1871086 RepID=UPI0037C1316C
MTEPLLSIDRVSVARGDRPMLDDVSLLIPEGRHTAILGRNGSGKSTLVKLITRQLYPTVGASGDLGQVRIFGRSHWDVFELRGLLGVVSPAVQSDFAAEEGLEVFDAVVSGFFAARGVWNHRVTEPMRAASREALERMGVAHLIGRRMATLSTGEARRVLIARALVHRPRALLLDEPCGGLDPATRRLFLEALREVARSGVTLVLVTHHIEEILPEIDHLVMLQGGRVLNEGAKADLLTGPVLTDLFGLPTTVERRGDWSWAHLD